MTVLSVAKRVCLVVGLDQPSSLVSNTDREYMELARLADEIAKRIMKVYDWQALQKPVTFTGDAASEAFDLPSDYDRMPDGGEMWSSRWTWAFNKVSNTNEWLEMQVVPWTFINGNWIIYGDQFHFQPIMGFGETIKFFYVSNLYARPTEGAFKSSFTSDSDTFRLSEYLLELGMIWQWRANKNLSYEEDMQNYEQALNKLMKSDRGAQAVLSGNRDRVPRGARLAFPQTVGG